jgi:Ca2+-binding RTX toxin-like protein
VIIDLSEATEGQVIQLTESLSQANVYIIDSDVGVTITFNTVDRVIVGDNGDDFITVNGDHNTTLEGGNGNDTLVTSGGNDSVTGGAGDDSVSTGAVYDTIVSGSGSDTVDAGAGYDLLQMSGSKSSYSITVQNGALVIDGVNDAMVNNAEYISFTGGGSMTVSGDVNVAAAMRMYESLLERSAEFGGAKFWSEAAASGSWTTAQIAEFFLYSDEFQSKFGSPDDLTDEQFVQAVYENSLGRDPEPEGLDFWVNVLETDAYSRSQVTVFISGSPEAANHHSDTVQFIEGWI